MKKAVKLTHKNKALILYRLKQFFNKYPIASEQNFYPDGRLKKRILGNLNYEDFLDRIIIDKSNFTYFNNPEIKCTDSGILIPNASTSNLGMLIRYGTKLRIKPNRIEGNGELMFSNAPLNFIIKPAKFRDVERYLNDVRDYEDTCKLYDDMYDELNEELI